MREHSEHSSDTNRLSHFPTTFQRNNNVYTELLNMLFHSFSTTPISHTLQWPHNGRDSVSNHQPHGCLLESSVYSDADQRKHQSSASLAFVREFTGDRWIPRTNGQERGKCFHLMTSSCIFSVWPTNVHAGLMWIVLSAPNSFYYQFLTTSKDTFGKMPCPF